MFYPLNYNSWNEEEMKALLRVLRSGQFTAGEVVNQFEMQFASKCGAKYAVMTNSGSSANLLAIASLFYRKNNPLKRGDEVIVPALGWPTTYSPLQQFGLKIKIVDIDFQTLTMDVNALERAISPKTKMILVVNLLGNATSLDVVKAACKHYNLSLVEDNCDGLGAEYKGIKCGMWGELGTFSFHYTGQLSTMEGGMIVTDDRELYHLAKCMRGYGITKHLPPESPIYVRHSDPFDEHCRAILPGYNVNPLEICGAIGTKQLKKFDGMVEVRRQNACLIKDLFGSDERFILQKENGKSSWTGFSILLNPRYAMDRKKVFQKLTEEGIQFKLIGGGNFARQDVLKLFEHELVGDLRMASMIQDRAFQVGNHPQDLTRQIERVHKVLTGIAANLTGRKAA